MADLIIILGNPASGKSTLARRLCTDLALPCLSKDDIKEALFETLGVGDRDRSRRYSDASFAALLRLARTQLDTGVSCVLEGNWRAEHAAALRSVAHAGGAAQGWSDGVPGLAVKVASTDRAGRAGLNADEVRTAQIWCCAPALELAQRFISRARHPGHLDADVGREKIEAWGTQLPAFVDLAGPRWTHDSGDPASYGRIVHDLAVWRRMSDSGH